MKYLLYVTNTKTGKIKIFQVVGEEKREDNLEWCEQWVKENLGEDHIFTLDYDMID